MTDEQPVSENSETKAENAQFGYWLVGFVDLLGQQSAFLKADEAWELDKAAGQRLLKEALKSSVGTILGMRKLLAQFRSAFRSTGTGEPGDPQELVQWRKARVREDRWSDGIVLSTPLSPAEDHNPISAVFEILVGIGGLALMHLAAGRPLRAGVSIGGGIECEGELFGPALVKAYQLESKAAGSPRVVVDAQVYKFLETQVRAPASAPMEKARREMALLIQSLLVKDEDGAVILDFAGPWFQQNLPDAPELLSKARSFAQDSRKEHRTDKKLFERYSSVVRYLESRMPAESLVDGLKGNSQ